MELPAHANGPQTAAGLDQERVRKVVWSHCALLKTGLNVEPQCLLWVVATGIASEQGVEEEGVGGGKGAEHGASVCDTAGRRQGGKGEDWAHGRGVDIATLLDEAGVKLHGMA